MTGLWEDLRHGLRALIKSPGSAVVAIASLALGIGANTTVVAMLNAMLLGSLPVHDPARLVAIYTVDPRNAGLLGCSYPNFADYRDRNPVFSSLLLYAPIAMNLTGQGEARLLMGAIVSGNYFATLGVEPAIGRAFRPEEDVSPGASPVAIISHSLWTRRYASDPRVTARTIRLNGHEFQIVGVAPESFRGLNSLFAADVWVPLMMYPQVFPTPALVQQRRARYFSVVGRLKPGVSMAQAGTAMQAIARNLEREWPNENQGYRLKLIPAAEAALATKTRSAVVNSGELLTIISGLVLLIACVNVANLLLARAAERNKEIAVRLALGASRWRLIRQLLTESAVLALTGGLAGLLVARWARDLLWSLRPPMFNYAAFHLDFDTPVLVYTLGISVFAGMLFGLAPALRATRPNLATDLKERSGRAVPRVGRWNLRSILVIEQVAFSLITLVAAGLFVRSMRSASQIDPGFDAAHLAAIGFNVSDQGYSTARGQEFQRTVLERLSALRSVDGVSLAKDPPLRAQGARTVILRGQDNAAAGGGRITLTNVVWPGYFRTLRIGLMRGRDFSNLDTLESPRVAIVNEAAAAELWPGQDATEKALEFGGENVPVKVVGVVRNATYRDFFEPPPAMIYLSLVQYYFPYGTVYIHSRGKPETALAEARREMAKLDRNLVLVDETLQSTIRETLWAQRLSGQLLGVFGLLALVLSAIGIYGVVSFSVERRLREIGIRMALGATGADVQTMVIGEGMRMVLAGVIAGLAVSLATSHMVKSMLLVVGPRDAFTFVLVPSMLTLVAMLACWLPARRATRVKPAIALREE